MERAIRTVSAVYCRSWLPAFGPAALGGVRVAMVVVGGAVAVVGCVASVGRGVGDGVGAVGIGV